jgi:hypothetical protein
MMTDSAYRRLDEKLDKVLDGQADLRVKAAAMHEHIKAVDDDNVDLKDRVQRMEYRILPALGGLAVLTPIIIWLLKGV